MSTNDLNDRKELRVTEFVHNKYTNIIWLQHQLTGSQLFIRNMFNPNTLFKRLLINWQTGVGKSIAAISIGNEFIKHFRKQYKFKDKIPKMVCVLGFSTMETIQADLLKYPELGYVSPEEVSTYQRMMLINDPGLPQYSAMLHKRLSNTKYGGYYKFFGYREFVNNIFRITEKGTKKKMRVDDLFIEGSKIQQFIDDEYIDLNYDLLDSLKNGLIIADEIHNVYNSLEINNYGFTIKYVMDKLGDDAPRAVYMSATPLTGNAGEIIDLLNILIPNANFEREDFFDKDSQGQLILKPGATDVIEKVSTGYVSYLLDTDKELYPERIFIGEQVEGISYIKMNISQESKLHSDTIEYIKKNTQSTGFQTYSINDMVFPNPDESSNIGLYENISNAYYNASKEFLKKYDISILTEDGYTTITGNFLELSNLKTYSVKYYNIVTDIIKLIKNKEYGKIMVYHHNVQQSGVLLIQEIFRINGFLDETESPVNNTLCSLCGSTFLEHRSLKNVDHDFIPCRFVSANSKISKNVMKNNIAKYNDVSNLDGSKYKLLIGSRIIREGLNFKAVRYQYICSLPINFPILIQVLGRVVRKDSHSDLEPKYRNVKIKIYANTVEIPRYISKSKEYLVIQQVDRALRANAVDNFINYKKISTPVDTLESLKFTPLNIKRSKIITKYFNAYDYVEYEINLIKKLIFLAFNIPYRNIWTKDDLFQEIIKASNVNYNLDLIDRGNFEIALSQCTFIKNVGTIGNSVFYLKTNENKDFNVESYFRSNQENASNIQIDMTLFKKKNKLTNNFMEYVNIYIRNYLDRIELTLTDFPSSFHITIIRKYLESPNTLDNHLNKFVELYKRFKIFVYENNKVIGYLNDISVTIYNEDSDIKWSEKPPGDFKIGRRFIENDLLVGYYTSSGFKIRDPIKSNIYKDIRTVKTGTLCSNYSKKQIIDMISKLQKFNGQKIKYHEENDDESINEQCNIIKMYLLTFEERSRQLVNGLYESIRWVYLFNDNLPRLK